nr:hypothetical protein [Tanacetum cinerariifolium]
TNPLCDPSSARVRKYDPSMPASHVDLLCAASVSHKSPIDPRRWLAIKILYGHQYTLPRPPVLESVAIKYQCAAASAREATDEGITGETDSDSRCNTPKMARSGI